MLTPNRLNAKSARLALNNLELHYQPLVSCGDRSLVGHEALLRLRGVHGRLAYPDEFLSSFNAIDLRLQLGHWVIAQVMHDYRNLNDGFVTLNLGARELAMLDLEEVLLRESAHHGIALDRVVLEITEQALPSVSASVIQHLQRLRSLGVQVAIDDFGVGYSCLALLSTLPCDLVKLDRLFLHHAADNPIAQRLFESITTLCRDIGLTVLAEGVEHEWQARMAEDCGCQQMQGYYLGYPTPIEIFRQTRSEENI